jgi:hypothetical protein
MKLVAEFVLLENFKFALRGIVQWAINPLPIGIPAHNQPLISSYERSHG